MNLLTRSLLLGSLLLTSLGAGANPWRSLYGDGLMFDVFRDGKAVGHYETRFKGEGANWRVDARLELEVPWLWWNYSYRYHGIEVWEQGTLTRLEVSIDENGRVREHRFDREGSWLRSDAGVQADLPVLATHHYDMAVVEDEQVINTLTGKLSRVSVQQSDPAPFHAAGKTLQAVSYRYLGDGGAGNLAGTQAWYDLQGRWVGLEFTDSRGATVELRCRYCGIDTEPEERL